MKRLILGVITMILLVGCSPQMSDDRPLVLTSMYPLYDLTTNIAKDTLNVQNIAPLSMEVHEFEPSPKDIVKLEKADLLIVHGSHLEGWLDSTLKAISNKSLKVLVVSDGIKLLDGDVHTWLSIDHMISYANLISNALSDVSPENTDLYDDAKDQWVQEANQLKQNYQALYENTNNKEIIVDHLAFNYLAKDLNLTQVSITQGLLSSDLSAHQLKTMIDKIRSESIEVIYQDEESNERLFELLVSETNVSVKKLSTLERMSPKHYQSYLEMMKQNLEALEGEVTHD